MGLENQKNKLLEKLLVNFKYPIHKLKNASAIYTYPDLNIYAKEFSDVEDTDCDPEIIIRYLILMYTKGSPAVEQHPDNIGKRKTYVLELLGFEPDSDGKYTDVGLNELLLLRGIGIRQKFALFLSVQNSSEWAILCYSWESLQAVLTNEVKPTDPDEITKLQRSVAEIRNNIRLSMDALTVGDKSKSLEDAIESFRAHKGRQLRAEEDLFAGHVPIEPHNQKWPTMRYND